MRLLERGREREIERERERERKRASERERGREERQCKTLLLRGRATRPRSAVRACIFHSSFQKSSRSKNNNQKRVFFPYF